MNTDNQVIPAPKPLKGKYDKRCKSPKSIAAHKGAALSTKQLGRKPNWMKHLSRNKAWDVLRQLDDIASVPQIYAYCWEKKKVEVMLNTREYLWNRAEGRPFIAENPEKAPSDPTTKDERLRDAVKQLLPPNARLPVKAVM